MGTKAWSKKIPDGPWDVIVIGSGMGGMTAAALLSAVGRRVLVIEQHYVPGGFTHTFRRPGYVWDVGVHAVGEVTTHTLTGRILEALTGGELRWVSLGSVYDEFTFPGGERYGFPDRPEAFRALLVEAFPGEEAAVDAYLGTVREVAASMRRYYLSRLAPPRWAGLADRLLARSAATHLSRTTAAVMKDLTSNRRLQRLLTAQWGYYGSPPERASFAIQALVTRHFLHGAYYPVGGSGRIAATLLGGVAAAGGWTAIARDVAEIVVDRGRAVGVRLVDGERIAARKVISAAGVQATIGRLLPEDLRRRPWAREILALPPAPPHVCLYIGFKGEIRQAGATAANQWFYETWDEEATAWEVSPERDPGPAPVLYTSFPSLKDPEHDPGPEQRHTGEVVTFVPWSVFAPWRDRRWRRRGADYEAFKEALGQRLLDQLLEKMPGLAPFVDYTELSTPVTTDHFVRPREGSIYGIEPTVDRFQTRGLRPHGPIGGLYFAGSEVGTVGVIGAMMGGLLAAAAAEPWAVARFLRRL